MVATDGSPATRHRVQDEVTVSAEYVAFFYLLEYFLFAPVYTRRIGNVEQFRFFVAMVVLESQRIIKAALFANTTDDNFFEERPYRIVMLLSSFAGRSDGLRFVFWLTVPSAKCFIFLVLSLPWSNCHA